ncbi:DNA-binding GntR family transcriptional regulator [Rhodoligotrophos appendicifer]|uniref:GntR family transcriptional regulator n=1 Tax=Rhodoligotrophos appendicifer TaxID=987056 RepID=UPI00147824A9|nr:GntR family transcriptional regulator [Rhodoligotrophos appendicifer]
MRPLEPALLHDRVYETLMRAVMAGQFIPGQRVVVREIAERLDTSPMPVREAIRRLVALRAFESLPNRTVQVPSFSPETVRDLCRVRVGIEGMAAEWAAENATPKILMKLRRFLEKEVASAAKGDFHGMLEANRRFHFCLYEAAGSDRLMPCLEMLWLQIGPYFGILQGAQNTSRYHEDHFRLVSLLESNDGPGARQCLGNHITMAAEDIIAAWGLREA